MKTKTALPVLFLTMFFVMVGFGIIIPVLPFYAEELGATPTELGWIMAAYSIMQLIFAPIWGKLSDKVGRKPIMLIGIFGLSISFFLTAISTEFWMLFAARVIGGLLSAANLPTAMAYVADITTPENRSKGMGMIGAAVGLGFIFGPAIGGVFSKISLQYPFIVAGVSSMITFFLVLFILKESLPKQKRTKKNSSSPSQWIHFTGVNRNLYIIQFFVSFTLAGLETTFAYFAYEKAGLDSTHLGYIFMIMGLAGAIVQGGLMGVLAKKFGEQKIIQGGIIVSGIGFALILLTTNFATAAIFISIFGIGNGVIRPAISTILTRYSDGDHGSVTGLLSSFDSLGRIAGPPVGGLLFSYSIGLPFIAGFIISIVALLIFEGYRIKVKQTV